MIANSGDPSRPCPGVPDEDVYDPASNPDGVKCTLQDYMVNVFGRRPDGFANRPIGNTGIQYGLEGLQRGLISPAQFVDLNTKVGGLDYDGEATPDRVPPDLTGLDRAYRTGAVNSANNLDQVAIIDLRGPDPGAFHDVYRTYAMRARLLRNFGTAANQVLWRGQVPAASATPPSPTRRSSPSTRGSPGWSATAATSALAQQDHREPPCHGHRPLHRTASATSVPPAVCDQTVAAYGTPRMAAGGPLADDTLQCQLKPLDRSDYDVAFTDEQWAKLQATFPTGRLRLHPSGRQAARRGRVADLPGRGGAGRVRRPAARTGTRLGTTALTAIRAR